MSQEKSEQKQGRIIKVSGPLIVAEGMYEAKMYDVAKVSEKGLVGEVIELRGDRASIQVYEETGGLGPGEPVSTTGQPLSVELAPGLMESIFDGIQRPLDLIQELAGDLIPRGISVPSLSREKKWSFTPKMKVGDKVIPGDILGVVPETSVIEHRILVPEGIEGEIKEIKKGEFTIVDTIAKVDVGGKIKDIIMLQKWPVRKPRLIKEKLPPCEALVTGQRVIDTLFPLAKGGTACVPGPFGSGKTVVQHQLAKWADADIIVFIGCGERGNEMTDVLLEFPELKDPRTGEPLMKRTVLIANTSNMPVAAREASIYTGITIAEYYRDMGYDVSLMADSTSRWAEALREMSGRLEEMPGEEGYPAYLAARVADFYERAGRVITLGSGTRHGSLSAIGAVSPPGGDLADPVVQATLKFVKVFWGLDDKLAYARHFPAINWLNSYSLYLDNLKKFYSEKAAEDWVELRQEAMSLLQQESELEEIVRLVGKDALSPQDQLIMERAKSIREDFLHQSAFHELDSYSSLVKQYRMLKLIMLSNKEYKKALEEDIDLSELTKLPINEKIAKIKFLEENRLNEFDTLEEELKKQVDDLKKKKKEMKINA